MKNNIKYQAVVDESLGRERIAINLQQYNDSATEWVPANLVQTYNQPILKDPSKWVVSVSSFQVPGVGIPLINLEDYVVDTTPDITLDFQVRMEYKGSTYDQRLIVPPDFAYPFPYENFIPIWEYKNFTDLVNTAFVNVTTALNADQKTSFEPPFIQWSAFVNRFQLWAPQTPFERTGSDFVSIAFNDILHALFDSLPAVEGYLIPGWTYLDVYEYPLDSGNTLSSESKCNTNVNTWGSVTYLVINQENDTRCRFVGLRTLILTSDLPTDAQWFQNGQNNNQSQRNILASYSVDVSGIEYVCNIFYTPTAEFRRSGMGQTKSPINSINMKFYYVDNALREYPLLLGPKESILVKILFEKFEDPLPSDK